MKPASHKKTHTVRPHLREVSRVVRFMETVSDSVGARSGGGGQGGELFHGCGVSVLQHEGGPGDWPHSSGNVLCIPELYTSKWLR